MYETTVKLQNRIFHIHFNGHLKEDVYGPYCDNIDITDAVEIVDDGDEKPVDLSQNYHLEMQLQDVAIDYLCDQDKL